MLGGSALGIEVDASALPVLPGARDFASQGMNPAGLYRNRDFTRELVHVADGVSLELADIVFDPQTSGGLLIALELSVAVELCNALHGAGIADAAVIARVGPSGGPAIRLV